MLFNYIKVIFRNLGRHRMYSMINILGLAFGIAGFVMIALWVLDELSFDRFHEKSGITYQVVSNGTRYFKGGFDGTPGPLAEKCVEELPEVTGSTKVGMLPKLAYRYKDNVFYEKLGMVVDASFLDIFSFKMARGDRDSALRAPSGIVLTESMARRYFGDEDPIGKVMSSEGFEGTVSGVLEDVPSNSTFHFDYLVSFDFYRNLGGPDRHWSSYNYLSFVTLQEGSDIKSVATLMTDIGRDNNSAQVSEDGCWYELHPLSAMHLASYSYDRAFTRIGDKRLVIAFTIASLMILILACINFMNLSTARAGQRAREIGLRKVVGADRGGIIRQFFGESLFYSSMAMIAAVLMIELAIPWFNRISGKELEIVYSSPSVILLMTGTTLFTAIIAGSYPAFFLSAFRPAAVLKGNLSQGGRGVLFRKILVVGQFSLTITLLITSAFLARQMHFISSSSLGFEKENLVYFPFNAEIAENYDFLKTALLDDPAVIAVSSQSSLIAEISPRTTSYSWEGKAPDHEQDMIYSQVDFDFFETMGMQMADGRTFSREFSDDLTSTFILNEEAIRRMKVDQPVGLWFRKDNRQGDIVGVVRDANLRSMHIAIEPHVFYITEDKTQIAYYGNVIARIDGTRTTDALKHIESVWNRISPGKPFEYSFMDETYDRLYKAERRAGMIVNSFSVFALIISCLGMFGMASFMAGLKKREIAIRKVLGASIPGIVYLLTKEFSKSVLLANLAAWPLSYLIVRRILDIYAYRIDVTPWIFIYAGALAFLIALLTISWQAVKAALADPARAVRYE